MPFRQLQPTLNSLSSKLLLQLQAVILHKLLCFLNVSRAWETYREYDRKIRNYLGMALKVELLRESEGKTENVKSNLLNSNIEGLSSLCYLQIFSILDHDCILVAKSTIWDKVFITHIIARWELTQMPSYEICLQRVIGIFFFTCHTC